MYTGVVSISLPVPFPCSSGYIPFLESLETHLHQLNALLLMQHQATTPSKTQEGGDSQSVPTPTCEDEEVDGVSGRGEESSRLSASDGGEEGSNCVVS